MGPCRGFADLADGVDSTSIGPRRLETRVRHFVLFVAGPLVAGAIGGVLFLGSILLSRAALELLAEEDEPVGARRWLLYPPLLVIYLGLLVTILLAPPAMVATFEDPTIRAEAAGWLPDAFWTNLPLLVGVAAGAWWVSLGLAVTRWDGAVRAMFRPFADRFERRHGVRLACVGFGLFALASTALLIVSR